MLVFVLQMISQACHGKGWLRIRQTKYGRESTNLIFITCQTANKNHMFFFPICSPPISVLFVNCEGCVNSAILSACKQILTFVLSFHSHCPVFSLKGTPCGSERGPSIGYLQTDLGCLQKAGCRCCVPWTVVSGHRVVFQHGHCVSRDVWSEDPTVSSLLQVACPNEPRSPKLAGYLLPPHRTLP